MRSTCKTSFLSEMNLRTLLFVVVWAELKSNVDLLQNSATSRGDD